MAPYEQVTRRMLTGCCILLFMAAVLAYPERGPTVRRSMGRTQRHHVRMGLPPWITMVVESWNGSLVGIRFQRFEPSNFAISITLAIVAGATLTALLLNVRLTRFRLRGRSIIAARRRADP